MIMMLIIAALFTALAVCDMLLLIRVSAILIFDCARHACHSHFFAGAPYLSQHGCFLRKGKGRISARRSSEWDSAGCGSCGRSRSCQWCYEPSVVCSACVYLHVTVRCMKLVMDVVDQILDQTSDYKEARKGHSCWLIRYGCTIWLYPTHSIGIDVITIQWR